MLLTHSVDVFYGFILCLILGSWTFYVANTAAKATSTLCLIWSAYFIARTRPWRKPNADPDQPTLTQKDKKSHLPQSLPKSNQNDNSNNSSCDGQQHQLLRRLSTEPNGELVSNSELRSTNTNLGNSIEPCNTVPADLDTSSTRRMIRVSSSLIRQSLWALYRFIHSPPELSVSQSALEPALDSASNADLNYFWNFVDGVAHQASIPVDVNELANSLNSKSRLPRLSRNHPITPEMLTRILIAFSKDPKFLDLLFEKPDTVHMISFLARFALNLARTQSFDPLVQTSPSPRRVEFFDPNLSSSNLSDPDSNPDSSMFDLNNSCDMDTSLNTDGCVDYLHPEYPMHLYVATLVANLSRHPKSHTLGMIEDVNKLIGEWSNSPSLHLVLLSSKIRHNFQVFSQLAEPEISSTSNKPIVYYPDVYRLDVEKDINQDWDFDVIFVNGMLGSVFYTWRQSEAVLTDGKFGHTSSYTKCWPRDWLSTEFPNARIIGIDASLKPFKWNALCPMRKFRRSLDNRAKDIMNQLQFAGIGRRPVVWVTHSAGGILVKEMLRLAKFDTNTQSDTISWELNTPMDASPTNSSVHDETVDQWSSLGEDLEMRSTNLGESTPETPLASPRRAHQSFIYPSNHPSPSPTHFSSQGSSVTLTRQPSFSSSSDISSTMDLAQSIEYEQLADQTKGIVFMSVPHRGNQSLFALYVRPFRWALTPEAIQLERDSEYLLDLHVWFNLWSIRQKIRVLTMAEKRLTALNRFWSVLLVPEDDRDREMGSLIPIDADHLYISKPQTPADLTYTSVIDFIHSLPFLQPPNSSVQSPAGHS